jgi:hypothetical protein
MDSKLSEPLYEDDDLGGAAGKRRASLGADIEDDEEPHVQKSTVWIEDNGVAEEEGPEGEDSVDGELDSEGPEIVELEEEEPEEVEVGLDELLRERFEGKEDVDYEQEAAARWVLLATEKDEEPRPRAADEFVCQSCFLIKSRAQLAAASRSICKDCAKSR